ncbi:tRNA uridine 5-carboxymethylaminomethyl modification enzyme MnmG [Profundibacterium mesophilum KAUST100406-0324]|uniref:tRNA uridine 5-carboxymethylaminomethyl modification enzyme MnmG n=1 Tax=Profundibacterium mesophilum KAUST100406-0324 TaxID=1037889 RepID=A0A921TBW1_9RHOB|nr:tRNA uridine 5-carboxymethylaminomethyl modification enzyme MnmG [Profundibacterium mesophilum KAUST100406-0324]
MDDLIVESDEIKGVSLSNGIAINASAVVLTTGTFLDGVIHIGREQIPAGRMGEAPSNKLADRIRSLKLPLGRLKTGTPPRIKRSSIDWDNLTQQEADPDPEFLSFVTSEVAATQISCALTETNERTHAIIAENLHLSAMHAGNIQGKGPRYCPSIEDKITRFADKASHQVFLEPEGLDSNLVYPNGISTSLPADVQLDYVRSIKGLEIAEIAQPGYAIEYDYVDPRSLDLDLQLKAIKGLFLAGQINGTTGYEEAGAQGLLAGINAARIARGLDTVTLSRSESYIGVMLDDLTSRGVTEPYRMFTSRAEFRLSLRTDNADLRLTPLGIELGVVGESRAAAFHAKVDQLAHARERSKLISFKKDDLAGRDIVLGGSGQRQTLCSLANTKGMSAEIFHDLLGKDQYTKAVATSVFAESLYGSYIERQSADIAILRREENLRIPEDIAFDRITGLSNELIGKLEWIRPQNLRRATQIEGMTPAALSLLVRAIKSSSAPTRAQNAS